MNRKNILRDPMVWKFRLYGFFKNLRFFEPFLVVYLIGLGLSLFHVGVLYSVRESMTYLAEVPSGLLADYWGRKRILLICFVLYVLSFCGLALGKGIGTFGVAMAFFGLGDALRSGAHKAMIYVYLEQRGWFDEKTFVYGRTRAWSLLGSALSSFLAVPLALGLPGYRWLFFLSALPSLGDAFLVWTYPDWLDGDPQSDRSDHDSGFTAFSFKTIRSVLGDRRLCRTLLSSSIYDGLFKIVKDYVQPMLALLIVGNLSGNGDKTLALWLGGVYGSLFLAGSLASASVWRLRRHLSSSWLMNISFDAMGGAALILAGVSLWGTPLIVSLIFVCLYVMKDARKPIFVDLCGDLMDRNVRATVLSVDSQLRALVAVVGAPLLGWIADGTALTLPFALVGFFMLAINRWLSVDVRDIVPLDDNKSEN